MKTNYALGFLLLFSFALSAQEEWMLKSQVIQYVDAQEKNLIAVSDKIWAAAVVAFQESVSSETLIQYAQANGFRVKVGVQETPTAFIAEYGSVVFMGLCFFLFFKA
jgi:aminobenzoyl-glutamate utilization protein B